MANIREIVAKLPKTLDGAVEYLHEQGLIAKHYLVYRRSFYYEPLTGLKESCVDVYCTHCKSSFKMGRTTDSKGRMSFFNELTNKCIEPWQKTECPECKHYVMPVPLSDFKRHSICADSSYLVSVHNVEGAICLLSWNVEIRLSRTGEIRYDINAVEGNIFSSKGCFKVSACEWYMGSISYYCNWHLLDNFSDGIREMEPQHLFPFDKSIIDTSELPYCKLDKYIKEQDLCHPALYMYLYSKCPNVESLITDLGPQPIQKHIEKIINYESRHYVRPKKTLALTKLDLLLEKTAPHKILGLTRDEYKYLKKKKESLFMMRAFSHNKKSFTLNQYNELKGLLKYDYSDKLSLCNDTLEELYPFIDKLEGFTLRKAIKYLKGQASKQKKVSISWDFYIDYLTTRKRLKANSEIFPRDLVEAHDYIMERYKEKQARQRQEKASKEAKKNAAIFTKRYEKLEKFIFSQGKYTIVPCKSETELFEEGDKLHHCVYSNYKTSYMNGITAIFFIRNKEKPTVPLYTVEFDENNIQILQNRGLRNCDPPADALQFAKKWLKYCKKVKENENGKSNTTTKPAAICA